MKECEHLFEAKVVTKANYHYEKSDVQEIDRIMLFCKFCGEIKVYRLKKFMEK